MFEKARVFGCNESFDDHVRHVRQRYDNPALFEEFSNLAVVVRVNRCDDRRMVIGQVRDFGQVSTNLVVYGDHRNDTAEHDKDTAPEDQSKKN